MPLPEPNIVLKLGARIFYDEHAMYKHTEIILNPYFTRVGDQRHDYQNGWAKVGAALVEAYRQNYTPRCMGHPSELIGEVRRWFRSNQELYEILDARKNRLTLVIRNGEERLLDKQVDERGFITFTPISRWTVEVIPQVYLIQAGSK